MITTMMLLAAVTISSVDENAIIRSVMDRYFLDKRSHPDARQSLFIAETMAEGAIDTITLRVPPSSPEHVDELAASIAENNRQAIALPQLPAQVKLADAEDVRGADGKYDWAKVDAKAIVEVSRPAFTKDGNVAVVRVVIRQPQRDKQELYFLQLVDGQWRLKAFGGGRVDP
ncbi:MAG TPA: hypothetical protein VM733_23105 [Thermoanaerobaculia bacterium]|nr:hypothetical protein [Thermoanaerobaculia bacterium]